MTKQNKDTEQLRVRIDHLRKCYHNSIDRDTYDGYGSMRAELFVDNMVRLFLEQAKTIEQEARIDELHNCRTVWAANRFMEYYYDRIAELRQQSEDKK